jgi:hypothetical protein
LIQSGKIAHGNNEYDGTKVGGILSFLDGLYYTYAFIQNFIK